ncbi:MAG: VCBS repeat-containing protein, partial [Verrucomicrobia bacterium]|nr:VCBS repeat-containing protein [Verrucomicrobiota bacterium]
MKYRWLLFLLLLTVGRAAELSWQSQPGYRVANLTVTPGAPGFRRMDSAATGVRFTNTLGMALSLTNTPVNNGSGLALGDFDGDGWCDVYFCRLEGPNALYRNLGNWTFEEIAGAAGVACADQLSTGAVFADIEGDGDLDLLVNSLGGGTRLFLNEGNRRFRESTEAGLISRFGSTSLALADVDGDGDLDLYVVNYRTSTILDQPQTRFSVAMIQGRPVLTRVNGVPATSPEMVDRFTLGPDGSPREAGEADVFYLNEGGGKFRPASFAERFQDDAGKPASPPLDWGLAVMFRDLNQDGAPDLYVCNDTDSPDRIWMNDGTGHFQALSPLALRHTSLSSMGLDVADFNRDGWDDLFVVDMLGRRHLDRMTQLEKARVEQGRSERERLQFPHNTLFLNRGDGTYTEVAQMMGLAATDWSWTPLFLDVDLDGFEDVLIANGFHRNVLDSDAALKINQAKTGRKLTPAEELDLRRLFPDWRTANLAYRNEGGLKFREVGKEWGFGVEGVTQGMAEGDLDNDGDLDVVLNNLNEEAVVLRNEGGGSRVAVRL